MSDSFHRDLRLLARFLPRSVVSARTLPLMRRLGVPAKRDVERGDLGETYVLVHRPPVTKGGALLWMHGGGYVMGSPHQDNQVCRFLANELGIVVAAVGYRFAPEHPFPTPLEDCHRALVWLAGQDGVDPARIAVGGASAGGGLAAALALLASRRREVLPVFQLLAYPMLDDRTALREDFDDRHCRMWNKRSNRFGWSAYVGTPGANDVSDLAAPARCLDASGLPPAWIGVGSHDLFFAEDLAYAASLELAGVACQTLVVEGAFHGFDSVAPKAGVTRDFRRAQAAALRRALEQ